MLSTFLSQEQVVGRPPVAAQGGAPLACESPESRPEWTDADWAQAELRCDVRRLLRLPAGAQLALALAQLPGGPVCPEPHAEDAGFGDPRPGHAPGYPCACQVVVAAAWEACAAWVAAGAARSVVDAVGRAPVEHRTVSRGIILDPAREELAVALRMSAGSMGTRINAARALVGHPALVALVSSGAISSWAGRLVLDQVAALAPEQATAVVDAVVDRVRKRLSSGRVPWTSAEVSQCARGTRMRMFPDAEVAVRARAVADRQVSVHPHGSGTATLAAVLAETDAVRIHRRLGALAAGLQRDAQACGGADPRTRDQIRADLLVDLLLGAGAIRATNGALQDGSEPPSGSCIVRDVDPGHGPGAAGGPDLPGHGPENGDSDPNDSDPGSSHVAGGQPDRLLPIPPADRPQINVIVQLETLLGLADEPAQVSGLGAIPADLARELAADGRWRAWLVDAAGAVTATGTTSYVPTAEIARLVRARHPHCRFPGCRQAAASCDLDHAIPYPAGPTTPGNLGPLCRRHPNLKTHAGWRLEPDQPSKADGADDPAAGWSWRTPAGLRIWDGPEPPDSH